MYVYMSKYVYIYIHMYNYVYLKICIYKYILIRIHRYTYICSKLPESRSQRKSLLNVHLSIWRNLDAFR